MYYVILCTTLKCYHNITIHIYGSIMVILYISQTFSRSLDFNVYNYDYIEHF